MSSECEQCASTPQWVCSEGLRRSWGWLLAAGIALVVLGVVALSVPCFVGLAMEVFLGWLLVIGGVLQGVQAFRTRGWGGFFFAVLSAALYIVAGVLLLGNPMWGLIAMTLLLAVFFVVEGIFKIIMALTLRPMPNWGWILVTGILAVLIGILIWSEWPSSAGWVIGLFVGIEMIFTGWATIMLALVARRAPAQ